jgi:hypothetical protein
LAVACVARVAGEDEEEPDVPQRREAHAANKCVHALVVKVHQSRVQAHEWHGSSEKEALHASNLVEVSFFVKEAGEIEHARSPRGSVHNVKLARFHLHAAVDRSAKEANGKRVREAGDNGERTKGGDRASTTGVDERNRGEAFGPAPVDLLDGRWVRVTVGGDEVVDVGPRVGGGDEVKEHANEHQVLQELHEAMVWFTNVETAKKNKKWRTALLANERREKNKLRCIQYLCLCFGK